MCGIIGIIDTRLATEEIRARLRRMNRTIVHRGPDDEGLCAAPGIGLGMRRLSIIDVAGGHQPVSNETGDIQVVCNGEIYNHEHLRRELEAKGHRFLTRGDAEVIPHLYEEEQENCFTKLRGMFAIAIWDARRQRVVLGRDRLGKKPLFVGRLGDAWVFGSEIKALLAAEPELAEPDYSRLDQYLQFGYIHEPHTIYRRIQKLPAAHFLVWQAGRERLQRYWDVEFVERQPAGKDWREELDQLLLECVQVRLQSDVPLGVFLSGGLDSSAIVAYAHRAGLNPLKTFTIGFDRPEWDESEDALRVARHFHTEHHCLRLTESQLRENFPQTLDAIVRHFDEPFGDESAIPTYHVSRLARQEVTVILSGDGGDELFAGYSSYRGVPFAAQYRRWVPYSIGRFVLPGIFDMAGRFLPSGWRFRAQRVARVLRDSALPLEQGYRDKSTIWRQADLAELLTPDAWAQTRAGQDQYLPDRLWAILRSDRDLVSRLTECDLRGYLLDDILVKVDRMSMAHGLEVRCPFLDQRMVEFAASIPSRLKIRRGVSKAILRDVLNPQLPRRTMRKSKQGFAVPLRDWFRGPMWPMLYDRLAHGSPHLPDHLFQPRCVQRVLREHRQGTADHSRKLWFLLVFATWHETYQSGALQACAASQVS